MRNEIVTCDICAKIIDNKELGFLRLTGARAPGTARDEIMLNDVCYECTRELFKHVNSMKKADKGE